MNAAATARLCFVGPLVGRKVGNATMQAEKLADLLTAEGYSIRSFSSQLNPYLRLLDTAAQMLRYGPSVDVTLLEIYGGRSFVIEDLASRLAKLMGHRLIMTLHGGALPEFTARHPRWAAQVLGRADVMVAPSEYLARMARARGWPVRIIPNVVDLSGYPHRTRTTVRPSIWWMRSFHDIYNPAMAIRVLAELRARGCDATLTMSGPDKGMESQMRTLAAEKGLGDRVRFAGFLELPGKVREAASADVFINTSRIDNMPVALIEACAFGLPVVTTRVGGIPDLLAEGQEALMVPSDDHVAMADAIERLVRERDLAETLSRSGLAVAARSSWPHLRPLWQQLFG